MEHQKIRLRFSVITALLLLAAFSRLIPHPANFAPIGAMALFGAAYFKKPYFSLLIPIASIWLSDLVLNNVLYSFHFGHFVWFYSGFYWVYGAFVAVGLLGVLLLRHVNVKNVLAAGLLSSVVFFVLSNFGVWWSTPIYPPNMRGLMACFAAGLPFFKYTLAGDLVYLTLMFGVFELVQYRFRALRPQSIQ